MYQKYYKNFIILIFCLGLAQEQGLYLDIANELLVRKKLSSKLPDVFDDAKFVEVINSLDQIAQVQVKSHNNRLLKNNPELHWCYALTYYLADRKKESSDHYHQYKVLLLRNTLPIHEIFQKNIDELEAVLETQQSLLANDIYIRIQALKTSEDRYLTNQISDLQYQINKFNELNPDFISLAIDDVLGFETKSAIYDFEKDNPYISSEQLLSKSTTSVEISSPVTIKPVVNIIQDSEGIDMLNSDSGENKILFPLNDKIIFDEDKISSIPGTSIAEVLEYAMGVNLNRQGAADVLASISIFGGTDEQTLILVDGLKISNQQTLHHDLDLPINIDDIQQIEVYRNAAAREYGTGAVSGVVNIVTKRGDERSTYFSTEYGDYAFFNGNLGVNIPIGKSFHNLSYTNSSSTGYLQNQNTDHIKSTFYYKYYLEDGKSSTNFSFGYLNRGNGINNHLSNVYNNQYEKNSTKFFNSKIKWDFDKIKLESNTHWFDHIDELAQDKDIGGWENYTNNEIGCNFHSIINYKIGTIKTGFNFNRETNSSTTLKEKKRDHYSLNFQNGIYYNQWNFNTGISGNYYTDFGWYLAPGYKIAYNINNNANIYHKYDHGFRLPSFYELHSNDYLYSGYSNLSGETSNFFEYGIQLYGSPMTITLSMFNKNSQNIIDWYPITSGILKWQATNIADVLTSGHNISFELFPKIIKRLGFMNRFEIGYSYLDIEHNGTHNRYRYLSNYLKHQLIIGTQYNLPFGISRSWYVRYEQPTSYDNRTIIDTQISYSIWRIETSLNINNIFDTTYEDVEDVTLPGRWIKFNLRFTL